MKQNPSLDEKFWETMSEILATRKLIIDRPKQQPHPRYPEMIYPFDYGYLEGTSAADGGGIDVWVGSQAEKALTGIICTFDTIKNDAEIKLLAGCSKADIETILNFHGEQMRCLYIPKPEEK